MHSAAASVWRLQKVVRLCRRLQGEHSQLGRLQHIAQAADWALGAGLHGPILVLPVRQRSRLVSEFARPVAGLPPRADAAGGRRTGLAAARAARGQLLKWNIRLVTQGRQSPGSR